MAATAPLQNLLRTVFLGMLMLGLLVRPVLSLACEIGDSQHALAQHQGDAAPRVAMPVDDAAAGDCCALVNCGDCCSHATAAVMLTAAPSTMPAALRDSSADVSSFQPAPPGVDLRPPISA